MKMKHLYTTILVTSFIFLWSCSSSLDRIQSNPSSFTNQDDSKEQASKSKKGKNLDGIETLAQENISLQDEPLSILEDALYVYQDSQLSWEKGDFDTALATLDDAYSLILKLNLPPDSPPSSRKKTISGS